MKTSQRLVLFLIRAKFKFLSAISKKKAVRSALDLFCTPPSRDRKAFPVVFQRAEQLRFPFGQFKIAGYRWNAGARKRVLICHGFESAATNFSAYVDPLVRNGCEVLMFDAPAHGYSSGRRVTVIEYRDLIKYVHTRFGPIDSFMGHSLGALAACLALSELTHPPPAKLVLLAPATQTDTAITRFFSMIRLDPALRPLFDGLIMEKSSHPVSWFNIGRAMRSIKAQVLWMHDSRDSVTPLSDAIAVREENFPNLVFFTTEGLGHSGIYRDQQVMERVVKFLTG